MLERAKKIICEVKDFPKPGIGFKDITPLVEDGECFHDTIRRLTDWARKKNTERVVGIESRGFIFGAPVAYELRTGMTIVRKKGKLPRQTAMVRAPNEYALEHFEIHRDSITPGQKVLIIDDLIATGSSSISAISLVKELKGEVVGYAALVELSFLKGKEAIRKAHPDVDVMSLIQFEE
ncbi:MAG: adenine phosphoribosyltransferase [Candidatus Aminicenantes bacterium]